ncbi:MAG: hypothetical protein WBM04_20545 [Candidatus Korobacteraceae bacterium]
MHWPIVPAALAATAAATTAALTTATITLAAATVAITGITMIMSEPAHRPSHNHWVFLVLLIALMISGFGTTGGAADSSNMDAFAKCLANKHVTMYGSFLCPHCDDQKKLLGASFKYVPYVECAIPGTRRLTFTCQMAQIQFTPTWIFADGERRTGVQSLQQLSTKTGCRLP